MDGEQLRDEVVTLLIAGHETTASALTWAWYLLARHAEAERRLREELAAVVGGSVPALDQLPGLAYTRIVLEETMRLYPPGWTSAGRRWSTTRSGGSTSPPAAWSGSART